MWDASIQMHLLHSSGDSCSCIIHYSFFDTLVVISAFSFTNSYILRLLRIVLTMVIRLVVVAVAADIDVGSSSHQPIQHKKTKSPRKSTVVGSFLRNEMGRYMHFLY